MSDLKATQNINFPEVRTYWIAYTNTEIFSYGYIDPNQELNSGQPYLYSSTDMNAWVLELQEEFNVAYPDLPSEYTWGYMYSTKEEAQEAADKLLEYSVSLVYNELSDFWYFVYEPGMEEILGSPVIVEKE